jgi:acetyl-CoA acetyltransferase
VNQYYLERSSMTMLEVGASRRRPARRELLLQDLVRLMLHDGFAGLSIGISRAGCAARSRRSISTISIRSMPTWSRSRRSWLPRRRPSSLTSTRSRPRVRSIARTPDPRRPGFGTSDSSLQLQPAAAIREACRREGIEPGDLDLVEINEAFAAVALASIDDLGLDPEKVNVDGGAIALGHPIGMSGARTLLHLALALRRRGGGIGAVALCGGGGQGDALILRVPDRGAR